jgi:hypothetical protein
VKGSLICLDMCLRLGVLGLGFEITSGLQCFVQNMYVDEKWVAQEYLHRYEHMEKD